MSEWQPIETAPRDGTPVVLYSPGRCSNCPPQATRMNIAWYDYEWVSGRLKTGAYTTPAHSPTHWMPLPAAPTPSNSDQSEAER